MTVNKQRVKLLINALRSGEFEQGKAFLNVNGKYCCLGVACEIAIRNGLALNKRVVREDNDAVEYYDIMGGSIHTLPDSVRDWFGFNVNNPTILDVTSNQNGRAASAAEVNDRGVSFDDIADGFEQMYMSE